MFDFFTGPKWSIFFAGLGTIVAILLPLQIRGGVEKFYTFMGKQQKATQIIIGIVRLILAIFIPLVIFASIGLHAGLGYYDMSKRNQMRNSPSKSSKTHSSKTHSSHKSGPKHSSSKEE
jgi:hypothetical protein